ncbi:MAG: type II toxin-antitoxin system RelE/ParE family toxin [Candidatus Binatia bacterium]
MKIRFTPSGRRLFLDIINYLRAENPDAASSFTKRAETSLRRLEKFPDSGRAIPEFPSLPHREVIVAPYRFFYRTRGKTVWIVAVWHAAQLPEAPPKKRLQRTDFPPKKRRRR